MKHHPAWHNTSQTTPDRHTHTTMLAHPGNLRALNGILSRVREVGIVVDHTKMETPVHACLQVTLSDGGDGDGGGCGV